MVGPSKAGACGALASRSGIGAGPSVGGCAGGIGGKGRDPLGAGAAASTSGATNANQIPRFIRVSYTSHPVAAHRARRGAGCRLAQRTICCCFAPTVQCPMCRGKCQPSHEIWSQANSATSRLSAPAANRGGDASDKNIARHTTCTGLIRLTEKIAKNAVERHVRLGLFPGFAIAPPRAPHPVPDGRTARSSIPDAARSHDDKATLHRQPRSRGQRRSWESGARHGRIRRRSCARAHRLPVHGIPIRTCTQPGVSIRPDQCQEAFTGTGLSDRKVKQ